MILSMALSLCRASVNVATFSLLIFLLDSQFKRFLKALLSPFHQVFVRGTPSHDMNKYEHPHYYSFREITSSSNQFTVISPSGYLLQAYLFC